MTPRIAVPTFAAAAAVILPGCGAEADSSDTTSRAVGNGTDRAFVAAMVVHHQSAIEMAKLAQVRGESVFVTELAGDIVTTQTEEIETLRSEDEGLAVAGVKIGSLGVGERIKNMDSDPAMLKRARPFNAAFLKMMISHHQRSIEMAKAELAKGEDGELRAIAQDIIDEQHRQIAVMRKHLTARHIV